MANTCNYQIRVRGSLNSCLMVYESMPEDGFKSYEILEEKDGICLFDLLGDCKWSVDYKTTDYLETIDLSSWDSEKIEAEAHKYTYYSLRAKSEAFDCEIMCESYDDFGDSQFEHYLKGECIKYLVPSNKYNSAIFDWDKLEYINQDSEETNSTDIFCNILPSIKQENTNPTSGIDDAFVDIYETIKAKALSAKFPPNRIVTLFTLKKEDKVQDLHIISEGTSVEINPGQYDFVSIRINVNCETITNVINGDTSILNAISDGTVTIYGDASLAILFVIAMFT